MSRLTLERKKNWVPTSYLREEEKILRWVFLSYELLKSRKQKIFLSTSYIQGQVRESQGSRWVHHGWSIATRRRCEKVKKRKRPRKARRWLQQRQGSPRKPLSPPGLVYHHKKGTWESHKKKRKEKDQGRQEGGSSEGKVPCALNQEFLFFGSRVFGFGSGPSRLKYRLLRDLVYKEAMAEGSSGNGLLYAAKAVP